MDTESSSIDAVSTSVATIRGGFPSDMISSQPSSPRSSALPSPPDSPNSTSSFPSLSSSFFFSSAAASPPHHPHDHDHELVIPSLTLPAALRQPTQYGKTLGDVRLLVLRDGAALASMLFDGNEDVVDVAAAADGAVIRASTDWLEHRDAHGLEKFEPAHNVEIVDASPPRSAHIDAPLAHEAESSALDPQAPPSALLSALLSAPSTPLYTALVALSPTEHDSALLAELSAHVPVVVLPPARVPRASAFRPTSPFALRAGLFRAPETLALLRAEAADRFLRWREVERAVHAVRRTHHHARASQSTAAWSKAAWESEWDASLSHDVARRLREGTVTGEEAPRPSCAPAPFDPLHLPSLFVFSMSLFAPVKESLRQVHLSGTRLGLVLVGTLCAGVGIGMMLRTA
ncbi:hypothetical protein BV25DRAFT_795376 [Artomyces pyxidatus]|uniref:Uncharacterized protein n=1 Tax=Artomyces pyxidatus TaxID=48021 RepID=A0ACB8SXB8_9AGAM|nr:hypothetical protein BV25DRAFT_795376 [Artomyces pyxidatus]